MYANSLRVKPARKGQSDVWEIEGINKQNPPDIYFDTNVWIGMNNNDIKHLKYLQSKYGFCYKYSIINFIELVSHFADPYTISNNNHFIKYRNCFFKIRTICDNQPLLFPEIELLNMAGLSHYVSDTWKINFEELQLSVAIIANAENISEITGKGANSYKQRNVVSTYVIDIDHYKNLVNTDEESFEKIMRILKRNIKEKIKTNNTQGLDKAINFFMHFADFFFLERLSSRKVSYKLLTSNQQENFQRVFVDGVGSLFFAHFTSLVKKTIDDGRRIQPNDIYDIMQVLFLLNKNRLFVTGDKFFYGYQVDTDIQRFLPWSGFKVSE